MGGERKNPEADLEGYDDSQRAEVHEYEEGGPTDGVILTDITRDRGESLDEDSDPLDGFAADEPAAPDAEG